MGDDDRGGKCFIFELVDREKQITQRGRGDVCMCKHAKLFFMKENEKRNHLSLYGDDDDDNDDGDGDHDAE